MDVSTENLAALLRSARLKAGMKKADLARLTGIAHSRLCRYESGNIRPDSETLSLICLNLNLPKSVVEHYAYRRRVRQETCK